VRDAGSDAQPSVALRKVYTLADQARGSAGSASRCPGYPGLLLVWALHSCPVVVSSPWALGVDGIPPEVQAPRGSLQVITISILLNVAIWISMRGVAQGLAHPGYSAITAGCVSRPTPGDGIIAASP